MQTTAQPVQAAPTTTPATATKNTPETEGGGTSQAPDQFAEWEKGIDALPQEKAEAALRKLLKKAPIKTKSGDREFTVDDFDHVKRSVSMERHFSKVGETLKKEREELESQREMLNKFMGGDYEVAKGLLEKQPAVMQAVARALHEKYEQEQKFAGMSPEQRQIATENEKLRAQLAEVQQERERQLAHARQLEEQRLYEATRQEMEQNLISILEAGKVPKALAPAMIRRLAPIVEQHMALETKLEPAELAQMVKDEVFEEQRALFGGLEGDDLLGMVGEDVAKKIASAYVARVRGSQQQAQPQQQRSEPKTDDELEKLAETNPLMYARMKYGMRKG